MTTIRAYVGATLAFILGAWVVCADLHIDHQYHAEDRDLAVTADVQPAALREHKSCN